MPTPVERVDFVKATNRIIDFITSRSIEELAVLYSKHVRKGPIIVTDDGAESAIYMKGEQIAPYPYRNAEGAIFWTGLPCGEENDKVVAEGTDFIVYTLNDNPGETHVFAEANPDSHFRTQEFLEKTDWNDWHRCRAMTAEDAVERYWDCQDQWRYYTNAEKGYVPTEEEVQNLVQLPPEERPEIPPRK